MIFKVEKTKNYTIMSNNHFLEKNMSLKAKGLLSLMLSLPSNWDYSLSGLIRLSKDNETSIRSALDELKQFGYLEIIKRLPNETKSGRFEYEYNIYEVSKKQSAYAQDIVEEALEEQDIENLPLENPVQLNTKESITKNKKESKKSAVSRSFDELIDCYTNNLELQNELKAHLKTRKMKKGAMTNRAIELSFKELDRLSNDDIKKIEIVQRSIQNGWTSFFELPKQKIGDYDHYYKKNSVLGYGEATLTQDELEKNRQDAINREIKIREKCKQEVDCFDDILF
jgi:hypothetical protein